jgi:hypothetical protein
MMGEKKTVENKPIQEVNPVFGFLQIMVTY